MPLRHVASQTISRLGRRFPILRRVSFTTVVLVFLWCYVLHWGERTTYLSHVQNCAWDEWEDWPQNAQPHHLVFITDPQLVDPHTYPGRPWPLSSLTESYTDLYMKRNFRLINQQLDPDSIVFLGDLFDGGREWAPSEPRALLSEQIAFLKEVGVLSRDDEEEQKEQGERMANKRQEPSILAYEDKGSNAQDDFRGADMDDAMSASSENSSNIAARDPSYLAKDGTDLRKFVPGENGRWSKWGAAQWDSEYDRFGKIFFEPGQLYPHTRRDFLLESRVPTNPASVINGAPDNTRAHFATQGGKQRRILTSLPGNHDIGFGAGVQLAIRNRFHSHFGETNNVNIIGNHTFISLDTPSFSAYNQWMNDGVTTSAQRSKQNHIWKPVSDFVGQMRIPAKKAVAGLLNDYYPGSHPTKGLAHHVTDDLVGKLVVEDLQSESPKLPVILLSHVPFYRNPDTDCGILRERGRAIPIALGYQYQNVLTPDLSSLIMKKFATSRVGNIEYIFSGDDHDYCDVTHMYNVGSYSNEAHKTVADMVRIREITIKSFSWAMGVRRPGFQLVSLWNPVDKDGHTIGNLRTTVQTQLCLLPDQLSIFLSYAFLFAFTMLILAVRAVVVSLRRTVEWEDDDGLSLPLFQEKVSINLNGKASGYSTPDRVTHLQKSKSPGRQRASSTSTATAQGNSTNLSVQRSYNARTRSVSPAAFALGGGLGNYDSHQTSAPLIDKAGYYPQLRWDDPDDSDEESHMGEDLLDSQAKSKKKRKALSKARKALNEFCISVVLVGIPSVLFYWYLMRND